MSAARVPSASNSAPPLRRVVFIANSMYSDILSGGDVHTLHMAAGAVQAGHPVHFLAGHALQAQLEARRFPVGLTVTDKAMMAPRNFNTLAGQLRMLIDYLGRLRGTMTNLSQINAGDCVYANTDFWWDSLPALCSRAQRKLMVLGMDCPTLAEIGRRSRPDVKSIRLPSVHYWVSQHLALRLFRRCGSKRLLYVHPNQKARLLKIGYRESELVYISNGIDVRQADAVPAQEKHYDVVWTGRIHKQKGIDDLLETLAFLAARVSDLRVLIIGNVQKSLAPRIAALGFSDCVHFSGFVAEAEKFRLLKRSRLFLMPSHYESWGIVIGEALAAGVPVVAFDLVAYRPIFGDCVRYVPAFDLPAFQEEALSQVQQLRAGRDYLRQANVAEVKNTNSWEEAQRKFCAAIASLG